MVAEHMNHSRGSRIPIVLLISVLGGVFIVAIVSAVVVRNGRMPRLQAVDRMVEAWQLRDYSAVIAQAEQILAADPVHRVALPLRGFASYYRALDSTDATVRAELLAEARRDLARALVVPGLDLVSETHYVLGQVFFHSGEAYYDRAIQELERARSAGIARRDLYEYLAAAYRILNRNDMALEAIRTALAIESDPDLQLVYAQILFTDADYLAAERVARQTLETSRNPALVYEARLVIGNSLRAQGEIEASLDWYRRAIEENTASAEAHFGMGEVYLTLGDTDLARFHWREAARLNPNHIESLQRLEQN